ncbi:MAG: response regulator transcription factor [Myxococcales bacterium]|jgi:DNA-binding NarL/FixJ family response regulator|nr:response regulator transcription factor [Myxococcales bacterium]
MTPSAPSTSTSPTRIFLVEDSPSLLKNLEKSLSAHPSRVEIVGVALDGESGLKAIDESGAELLLLDLELPGIDGIEVTRRLKARQPEIDILILTSFDDEKKVYEAIQAGASGYLVKRVRIERILDAIDEVRLGGTVLEPIIARRFWAYFDSIRREPPPSAPAKDQSAPEEDPYGLNEIEREILLFLGKGLSNGEVGEVMKIERRRVRWFLSGIYRKMGVNTHVEAVIKAIRAGLIEL